ncbi:hypothetical protein J1605_012999 [Eschrichtius robustus]|uniref:Uncharacterized protein n=1 Tax=Eschrichtius robustus TaxID=9764 RepID=A0AB34GGQ6_ESCRO|nr:hypothetical protein J1605_012999 [Eschrichtius robustus]
MSAPPLVRGSPSATGCSPSRSSGSSLRGKAPPPPPRLPRPAFATLSARFTNKLSHPGAVCACCRGESSPQPEPGVGAADGAQGGAEQISDCGHSADLPACSGNWAVGRRLRDEQQATHRGSRCPPLKTGSTFPPSPRDLGDPGGDSPVSGRRPQTPGLLARERPPFWGAVGVSPPGCPGASRSGTAGVPDYTSAPDVCIQPCTPVCDLGVELCMSACGCVECGENVVGVLEPTRARQRMCAGVCACVHLVHA